MEGGGAAGNGGANLECPALGQARRGATAQRDAALRRRGDGDAEDMLPSESRVKVEIEVNRLAEVVVAGLNGRANIALVVLVVSFPVIIVRRLLFAAEFREPAGRAQQAMGCRRQPDSSQSPYHDMPKQLHQPEKYPTQPHL